MRKLRLRVGEDPDYGGIDDWWILYISGIFCSIRIKMETENRRIRALSFSRIIKTVVYEKN